MKSLQFAVCDDSKVIQKIIGRIFTLAHIENVDYFDSGEILLETDLKYDVYLVDLVLQHTSGRSVIISMSRK